MLWAIDIFRKRSCRGAMEQDFLLDRDHLYPGYHSNRNPNADNYARKSLPLQSNGWVSISYAHDVRKQCRKGIHYFWFGSGGHARSIYDIGANEPKPGVVLPFHRKLHASRDNCLYAG